MQLKIKPWKAFYVLPVITLIIGVSLFIFLIRQNLSFFKGVESFFDYEFTLGNKIEVTIEEEGNYYLFIENIPKSNIYFEDYNDYWLGRIEGVLGEVNIKICAYQKDHTDDYIRIKAIGENQSVYVNDYEAIMTMKFDQPGKYVIDTSYIISNTPNPLIKLSLSKTNILSRPLLIFVNIFVLPFTIAVSISGVAYIRNKRKNYLNNQSNQ